ncbi:MAG: dihydroorotate dehydrogenase-like protein [Bacteroidales bacterium]
MADLSTSYLGLKLKNPIVLASSGKTASVDKIKEAEHAGAGAVVMKSVFEEQLVNEIHHGLRHDGENPYITEAYDYMSEYLRNNYIGKHLDMLRQAKAECKDLPIIASVCAVNASEWTKMAKEFEKAGADAVEINIFNVATTKGTSSETIEEGYLDIIRKLKKEVSIPISVKIGNYFTNLVRFSDQLYANGAKGVVMFNRFFEPEIDLKHLTLTSSTVFSNQAELRKTLRWIAISSAAVPKLDFAASTGIHDGEDLIKAILTGAKVGQLCSVIYTDGLEVIPSMLSRLEEFMDKWSFETIEAFRGRLNYSNIENPRMFERSQFMRFFSGKE